MKIVPVLLLLMGLASCKKHYTCHCVTTLMLPAYNITYNAQAHKIDAKLTKKQAEGVCQHEAEGIQTSSHNLFITIPGWTAGDSLHTNCVVEE